MVKNIAFLYDVPHQSRVPATGQKKMLHSGKYIKCCSHLNFRCPVQLQVKRCNDRVVQVGKYLHKKVSMLDMIIDNPKYLLHQ